MILLYERCLTPTKHCVYNNKARQTRFIVSIASRSWNLDYQTLRTCYDLAPLVNRSICGQFLASFPGPPPSFPSLAVLQATESWTGPGNEASQFYKKNFKKVTMAVEAADLKQSKC